MVVGDSLYILGGYDSGIYCSSIIPETKIVKKVAESVVVVGVWYHLSKSDFD